MNTKRDKPVRYKVAITGSFSFIPDDKLPESWVVEADSTEEAIEIAKTKSCFDIIHSVKVEILKF